jgi:hypothetical protein
METTVSTYPTLSNDDERLIRWSISAVSRIVGGKISQIMEPGAERVRPSSFFMHWLVLLLELQNPNKK